MTLQNVIKTLGASALVLSSVIPAMAVNNSVGILLGYQDMPAAAVNPQEYAAADFLVKDFDGRVLTTADLQDLDPSVTKVVWIHIDRLGIGAGFDNLPAEFSSPATIASLKQYLADGGNIYLSKHATQMTAALGRITDAWLPGIFGDGDGGQGTDVWTVNAHFGSMQFHQAEPDMTQVYDRRNHPIYAGLEVFEAGSEWTKDYPHDSFPMLGTGDGSVMHREDHNCMWDLNAYNSIYTTEGKNTLEKFEAQHDCTVLGTWGHVQDYCVAGIVDFNPNDAIKGRIVANGLAACEWAPRSGVNAYHSNLETLTANTLLYLGAEKNSDAGIHVTPEVGSQVVYYTIQGIAVDKPVEGFYIEVAGGKARKIFVK